MADGIGFALHPKALIAIIFFTRRRIGLYEKSGRVIGRTVQPNKTVSCINWEVNIEPTKKLQWIKGLKAAFSSIGAKQRDQYSWVAKSPEYYVFTAEIDHKDKENNIYNHKKGVFSKVVPPMTKEEGREPLSISHAKELFQAAKDSFDNKLMCRILLTKGTKSGTTKGGVKAAVDGDLWQVSQFNGSIENGFSLVIERVAHS